MSATAEQSGKAEKSDQPWPAHVEVVVAISCLLGILLCGCRIGVVLLSQC
jgi:hypothetical protein